MSFHLVDAIDGPDPAHEVHGRLTLPAGSGALPACLAVEAVGQLAGWAGLVATDFALLPVAAGAGRVHLLAEARAGATLNLVARIRTLRSNAVLWEGRAEIDGQPILAMERCTGPLLPVAELEAPELLRERYERLRSGSGQATYPSDVEALAPVESSRNDGAGGRVVTLRLPTEHSLYASHFPRRPVFPATLLLETQLRVARVLAGDDLVLRRLENVKVRSFCVPGERVEIRATLAERAAGSATYDLACEAGEARRVSNARVFFERRAAP